MAHRFVFAWLVLLSVTPPVDGAESDPMPEVYYAAEWGTDRPYFVAASRAITEGGEIDEKLLGPGAGIRDHLRWPQRDGCVRVLTDAIGNEPHEYRATLRSALQTSDWVFIARVTGLVHGFSGVTGGTFLRVEVEEELKGESSGYSFYYFYIPVGDFVVGGVHLCYTNHRYPVPPEIGDRLVLFVDRSKNERSTRNYGEFLWIGNDTGMIVLRSNGDVGLPERLRGEGLPSGANDFLKNLRGLSFQDTSWRVQP